ncbi:MAG: metallophosphoesterase [Bacteroidales bacterium]|nr:metallophosphoesterase [Bacteroidales bacterium]
METNPNIRRFAIGDIHGCSRTFRKLIKKLDLNPDDEVYILGDMINRGKDSSGVLNYIIKLRKQGYKIFPLRGNHEQTLLNVVSNYPDHIHDYLRQFKSEDLLSLKGNIKKKYLNLLESFPHHYELDNCIFVHAALNLTDEDIFADKNFMITSRYQLGKTERLQGKTLIHGHVSMEFNIIKSNIATKQPIICIDNGCIYGDQRNGYGKLVCLNIDTFEIITKKNCEIPI